MEGQFYKGRLNESSWVEGSLMLFSTILGYSSILLLMVGFEIGEELFISKLFKQIQSQKLKF